MWRRRSRQRLLTVATAAGDGQVPTGADEKCIRQKQWSCNEQQNIKNHGEDDRACRSAVATFSFVFGRFCVGTGKRPGNWRRSIRQSSPRLRLLPCSATRTSLASAS